jgi:hypothetical protein
MNPFQVQRGRPGLLGAIWGAIVLAVISMGAVRIRGMIFAVLYSWTVTSVSPPPWVFIRAAVTGMLWGAVLGRAIGCAVTAALAGDVATAGRLCRRVGGWCMLLSLLWWGVQYGWMYHRVYAQGGIPPVVIPWSYLLLSLITSIPLQASALVWIVGMFLPRHGQNTVQVTENLRL